MNNQIPAHNLKTALNTIVGFSKLLLSAEGEQALSEQQERLLQAIYQAGYRLMEKVHDKKPQTVVIWSTEKKLMHRMAAKIRKSVFAFTNEQVCAVTTEHMTLNQLQEYKEKYPYVIITVTGADFERSLDFYQAAATVIVISSNQRKAKRHRHIILSKIGQATKNIIFFTEGNGMSETYTRLIRKICRRQTGIALSGGAAHGLAHVGVLNVLYRENIPLDLMAGTSGGALYGTLFAAGLPPQQIRMHLELELHKHFLRFLKPVFSRSGLFSANRVIERILKLPLNRRSLDFSELKKPLQVITTDLRTGKVNIIEEGSVFEAVEASISIPVLIRPQKKGQTFLIDGVANTPLPVLPLKQKGADIIIAVQVSEMPYFNKRRPNLLDIFMQSRNIASEELARHHLREADIVIEPATHEFGYFDYHRYPEIIRAGEEAAQAALPAIRRAVFG